MPRYRIPVTVTAHDSISVDIPDGLSRAQVVALVEAAVGAWDPDVTSDEVEADYDGLDSAYDYAPETVPPPVYHDVAGGRWACDGYHMVREGWPHVAASSVAVTWLNPDPGMADMLAAMVPCDTKRVAVDPRFSPVIDHGARVAIMRNSRGHNTVAVYDADGALGALVMPLVDGTTTMRGEPVRVVGVA